MGVVGDMEWNWDLRFGGYWRKGWRMNRFFEGKCRLALGRIQDCCFVFCSLHRRDMLSPPRYHHPQPHPPPRGKLTHPALNTHLRIFGTTAPTFRHANRSSRQPPPPLRSVVRPVKPAHYNADSKSRFRTHHAHDVLLKPPHGIPSPLIVPDRPLIASFRVIGFHTSSSSGRMLLVRPLWG